MPAVRKPAAQRIGKLWKAWPRISSLLQKPAKGGMPAMAMQPIRKVLAVTGM